jgi:methylated-DNA-[protein]-cysteine S-methyltransferase
MDRVHTVVSTGIGKVRVVTTSLGVCGVHLGQRSLTPLPPENRKDDVPEPEAILVRAIQNLEEYFSGKTKRFSVPLDLRGTPFQRAVWSALLEIPYGETRSYGQVAKRIGKPNAARAVGMACHRNPIGIIIPCHRVIGASGDLTGYAGGLEMKRRLLALERQFLKRG